MVGNEGEPTSFKFPTQAQDKPWRTSNKSWDIPGYATAKDAFDLWFVHTDIEVQKAAEAKDLAQVHRRDFHNFVTALQVTGIAPKEPIQE